MKTDAMRYCFLFAILIILAVISAVSAWNTAIVTGASGYVGKAIVHQLLLMDDDDDDDDANNKEDQIICLVRPRRVQQETEYWKDVIRESSSSSTAAAYRRGVDIRVLPYDMLDGGVTLQKALQEACSCSSSSSSQSTTTITFCCVYHVASVFGPTEDHKTTALDNVKGTEDVVRTLADFAKAINTDDNDDNDAAAAFTCKLVVTSSMAAVRATGQTPSNGQFYTQHDWNTQSNLGQNNWGSSYQWSKTESERRARDLCNEWNIPMVALCPSFVFGPPFGPMNKNDSSSSSYSIDLVRQWTLGESAVQSRLFVDVRDLALAEVAAGRRQAANSQRYIVSTQTRVPSLEIAKWLQQTASSAATQKKKMIHYDAEFGGGAIPIGTLEVECTQRLEDELGVQLRPVKDTILDMAERLLEEEQMSL